MSNYDPHPHPPQLASQSSAYPDPQSHHAYEFHSPPKTSLEPTSSPRPQSQQRFHFDSPSPALRGDEGEGRMGGAGNIGGAGAALGADGKGRLRKACDSCSVRKVRCDESGPPCRSCAALDIPCTFARPSRRRGPPNRHAEAIKRRHLDTPGSTSGGSAPPSPISATAHALTSLSSQPALSAESICPLPILQLLIDDFFTYIHPLVPLPHEPTFRAAFARREDLTSCQFLALLASMIGALVASFPRKPRQHLSADMAREIFPSSLSLVERCHKIAIDARGPGYLDKELSVYDAATSYFLCLTAGYTFNIRRMRLYAFDCAGIMRALDIHKPPGWRQAHVSSPTTNGSTPQDLHQSQGTDYITQELGRRLFYVLMVSMMSLQQLGGTDTTVLMPPPTPTEPYPPLPLEIDDAYIFSDHIEPQPSGIISEVTGFNANVRVYSSYQALSRLEIAYGVDEIFDWERQKRVLDRCLTNVSSALDSVPDELMLKPGRPLHDDQSQFTDPALQAYPTPTPAASTTSPPGGTARKHVAYEIQKANIYASQLGTRSYLVEKYWALHEACMARSQHSRGQPYRTTSASPHMNSPPSASASGGSPGAVEGQHQGRDMSEEAMMAERESIIRDLLMVLREIRQVDMEPNGGSFAHKIRQIAATLLNVPLTRKGQLASRVEMYLNAFLDILMKLERLGGDVDGSAGIMSEEEREEQELRHWADLKELQRGFAERGGFSGLL